MRSGPPRLLLRAPILGRLMLFYRGNGARSAPVLSDRQLADGEKRTRAGRRASLKGTALAATIFALAIIALALPIGAHYLVDRRQRLAVAIAMTGGDPSRAPVLLRRYGCGGCHTVPGVAGADGKVAPPLTDLRERVFIGGGVPNTPDNLVRWIVSPQMFSPHSAMPASGIGEDEARDVAAFLYVN